VGGKTLLDCHTWLEDSTGNIYDMIDLLQQNS